MNINRNNYESFFLLYIDNELSVDEVRKVEEFVAENPDLEEEMIMLKKTILNPDEHSFGNKAGLFRTEVSASNLQEQLLMYLDNELGKTEQAALRDLVQH